MSIRTIFLALVWLASLPRDLYGQHDPVAGTPNWGFKPIQGPVQLLEFDEHGILGIGDGDIQLKLETGMVEGTYDMEVRSSGQILFARLGIHGVSKVFHDRGLLMLTIYDFFSEDGANEGVPVIIRLGKDQYVRLLDSTFRNTCNPVHLKDRFYFVNGLSLVETDMDFNRLHTYPIVYRSKEETYLDTYLICGLSVNESKDSLCIAFTPAKSTAGCAFYGGKLGANPQTTLATIIELSDD